MERGVSAINLLPPYVGNPTQTAVLAHLEQVLDSVADMPVVVQYVPNDTGTRLSADDLRAVATSHGNLRNIKVEVRSPAGYIRNLLAGEPSLPSLIGNGGVELIAALEAGATGVQPGGGFVEVYQQIWELWEAGEHQDARALHRRLAAYVGRWLDAGVLTQIGKAIAFRRGHIATPHCRGPLTSLGPADHQAVDNFLADFGELLRDAG